VTELLITAAILKTTVA